MWNNIIIKIAIPRSISISQSRGPVRIQIYHICSLICVCASKWQKPVLVSAHELEQTPLSAVCEWQKPVLVSIHKFENLGCFR
jgi:hypothetical protein